MLKFRFSGKVKLFNKNWWNITKKDWVPKLMSDNQELWPRRVSADGKPWKALSPSYQKWKTEVYGSLSTLVVTGEMFERSYLTVRGNKFIVKTTKEGVYNQFGTEKTPARPWMGVPEKSINKLTELSIKNILI